jgi:hypothetical protein
VVHGLDHEREALRPVVAPAGDEADAHGVAPGHQPVAAVLDFVQPARAGRRAVGGGPQARLDETQNGRHSGGYIARTLSRIEVRHAQRHGFGKLRRAFVSGNNCYPK